MGLSESKGRRTFVSVLRHMLRERGLKVSKAIAGGFYDFIVKVAPSFPEDGGFTLEDWKRLGRDMRKYLSSHKEEKPPPQTFPLWVQIRDILLEKSDLEFLIKEAPSEQDEDEAPKNKCGPPKYGATGDDPDDWDLEDARKYESEEYYPEEYNNPPPQVMISAPIKKHGKPVPKPRRYLPPVGFQGAIAQAKAEGDMSFTFPVVLYDHEEPTWEPLPLKTLKELRLAVKSLGPSVPYTIQILEMKGTQWLTVYDWFQTAKATLSPGDFVLWRTEYEERAKEAVCSSFAKKGVKPTMSMLLGEEEYTQLAAQMHVGRPILELITQLAVGSWKAVSKAVLSGGDYLLWLTNYTEQCKVTAHRNQQAGIALASYEMLAGEGSQGIVSPLQEALKHAAAQGEEIFRLFPLIQVEGPQGPITEHHPLEFKLVMHPQLGKGFLLVFFHRMQINHGGSRSILSNRLTQAVKRTKDNLPVLFRRRHYRLC